MIGIVAAAMLLAQIPQTSSLPSAPCSGPAFHQFDFLLGNWTASEPGGTDVTAHVSVTATPGGCGLLEREDATRGPGSVSLIAYDSDATLWRRNSVYADGAIFDLQGGPQNGDLVLEGGQAGGGGHQLVRITWRLQGEVVRETAERSTDGQSWSSMFDRELRRAR